MRIGVVGCGYWGVNHVRTMQRLPDVTDVIVTDTNATSAAEMTARFEGVRAVADLDLLIDSVDAVVVSTPPSTHLDVGLACLGRGRHVLMEKPLARTREESELLLEHARRNNATLGVGHTFRYNPAVWRLREAVARSELGRIRYVDSVRLNFGPVRRDVNVIADLASHDISILNYVLGSMPTAVSAVAQSHTHPTIEDEASIHLDYEDCGITATVRVSWLYPTKMRRTTVVGDALMAVFDDLDEHGRLQLFDRELSETTLGDGLSTFAYRHGPTIAPDLALGEPLMLECEDFVRSILDGRPPLSAGEDGLAVVAVVEAACRSARLGAKVSIPWDRPVRADVLETVAS